MACFGMGTSLTSCSLLEAGFASDPPMLRAWRKVVGEAVATVVDSPPIVSLISLLVVAGFF